MAADATHIERAKYDPSTFYLGRETWQVGPRYELLKYLGAGSFSRVCLAKDTRTGLQVALKKIGDVGSSVDNARKVLRELCILRRLSHPHIVRLHDAFCRPSPTGKLRLIKGELVSSSVDVYLALEYCEAGDLHHLTGQMSAEQIQHAMWQLTSAVKYMHALNVWHRDLKSANILLTIRNGHPVLKIADFGSARSAATAALQSSAPMSGCDDMDDEDGTHCMQHGTSSSLVPKVAGIAMRPTQTSPASRALSESDTRLLTMKVCTPCYRAPEVAIARGKYTSAMDMWSLGCIFGELLQRMERSGIITPKLKIGPVFNLADGGHATCKTPPPNSMFESDHNSIAKRELQAIFGVIGTPEWACIENVENERWRSYLRRLPPKAPHFMRRFGFAGEVAIDLLRRLLAFDPARRCSAEEALRHQYFSDMAEHDEDDEADDALSQQSSQRLSGSMLQLRLAGSRELPASSRADAPAAESCTDGEAPTQPRPQLKRARTAPCSHPVLPGADQDPNKHDHSRDDTHSMDVDRPPGSEQTESPPAHTPRHYYDEVEPAAALEALEVELHRVMPAGPLADGSATVDAIVQLIKREAEAEQRRQQSLSPATAQTQQDTRTAAFQARWWGRDSGCPLDPRSRKGLSMNSRQDGASTSGHGALYSENLDRPGTLSSMRAQDEANEIGYLRAVKQPIKPPWAACSAQRFPADAVPSAESLLTPGRHDEWGLHTGHDLVARAGPAWGGGTDGVDPRIEEIIKRQQAR